MAVVAACSSGAADTTARNTAPAPAVDANAAADGAATARLLFVGDVMLGRGIAAVVEHDAEGLFSDVRFVVRQADFAVANLESPLTSRPHLRAGAQALEADPSAARLLAGAGFDAVAIANNHAGDAGGESVVDTVAALETSGILVLGGGRTHDDAWKTSFADIGGIRIAYLAFDATGQGLVAGEGPGVAQWDTAAVEKTVTAAHADADVVVVGLHGGIEYSPLPDPQLARLGEMLTDWGVDVVWGHGPHVAQPVSAIEGGGGNRSVLATSLGNFLFDQGRRDTEVGLVLEVVVGKNGTLGYRTGTTEADDGRVHFVGWNLPPSDAVLWDGDWWTPTKSPVLGTDVPIGSLDFAHGNVVDASRGDITGDGRDELVVAYRHPFQPNPLNRLYPDHDFTDPDGLSAHVGVFVPGSAEPLWGAGTLFSPVDRVVACDGAMAVAYGAIDDLAVTGTGGWTWSGFGFSVAPTLPGPGEPGCADVDGDGKTEPVIRRNHG